jgi:hypothetical protein
MVCPSLAVVGSASERYMGRDAQQDRVGFKLASLDTAQCAY